MGYDLVANNESAGNFYLGAFSFPVLLEACGYLWPCIQSGAKWYCVFGIDKRMPAGNDYPALISNDGFPVTEEEAQIMARIARNFVVIQRGLPDGNIDNWPIKIREDFVDKFEAFAEWADNSGGFQIW